MIQQRRKRNSSRINLTISLIFHSALVLAVFFLAAREGLLGKKLKELTVTMVPKEKKPEPPKAKPEEPKPEPPREVAAKAVIPPPRVEAAAPPPADLAPAVAPAAVALPSFEFSDGAKAVQSVSDANGIYKALVEHTLRSRWDRPEDIADDAYVAEVELTIEPDGAIRSSRWIRGSGDARWDNSVKAVVSQVKSIGRPPPKGFPEKILVRFDVESTRTEKIQLSSR